MWTVNILNVMISDEEMHTNNKPCLLFFVILKQLKNEIQYAFQNFYT